MKCKFYLGALAATLLVGSSQPLLGTILTETFTDGTLAGGADNSGISWYDRSVNSGVSVASDATIGSGNALTWTPNNNTVTSRGFTGVFTNDTFALAAVGDTIDVKFDFRFTAIPANSTSGLTFGLYNSNGTTITADDSGAQDNDFGYRTDLGTGTSASIFLGKETNAGAGGTGTTTSGDTATITLATSTPVAINDTAKHSGQFTLTRTASGIDISVGYDGSTVATGSSTSALFTTFDEFVFSQNSATTYRIDNFVVTSNVPEPTMSVGLLLGAGMLAMRRRRRSIA